MRMRATAVAHPNIALVKYWGKRDELLNLPAAGSLSLTLKGLQTRTTVVFDPSQDRDLIMLNGRSVVGKRYDRLVRYMDYIRDISGTNAPATIYTENDFPTAAGLASSSSGFAALAAASCAALGLNPTLSQLSAIARMGSGSAARSIYGGYAEMLPGVQEHGGDAYAVPVASDVHWDLRCLMVLTTNHEKSIGSTEAMNHTAQTSPFFDAWVDSVPADIEEAKTAIMDRDFDRLAKVAEHSCLKFHASAIASDPGIIYWNGLTIQIVHKVRQLRKEGMNLFFTIDAGPHVKVFCESSQLAAVKGILRTIPGVTRFLVAQPGPGVMLEDEQGRLSAPWPSKR